MGLSISIGVLADLKKNDTEGAQWMEEGLAAANRLLAAEGFPAHTEPEELDLPPGRSSMSGFPYSFLHYLRRVRAYQLNQPGWRAAPLPDGADPAADPVLEEEYFMFRSHLLGHSDAEGYYVPVDFPDVLIPPEDEQDLPGGMLGSSQRLLAELVDMAPALGITLEGDALSDAEAARVDALANSEDGLYREFMVWLDLYEAARLSVEYKTAIVFS